jgi:hypothetical protein
VHDQLIAFAKYTMHVWLRLYKSGLDDIFVAQGRCVGVDVGHDRAKNENGVGLAAKEAEPPILGTKKGISPIS